MSNAEAHSQQIARLRRINNKSVDGALRGRIPSQEVLSLARSLGDDVLVAECLIARAVGLACTSRPNGARRCLNEVQQILDQSMTLGPLWAWRFHETCGIVSADFGEIQETWVHHQNALEIARRFEMGPAIGASESTLGLVSLRVGMLSEALSYLTSALEKPNLPTQVVLAVHLRLARVLTLQRNLRLADHHLAQAKNLGPQTEFTKMVAETGMMAIEVGALDLAENHAKALSNHAAASGGELVKLQSVLFQARLSQEVGETDRALAAARWVVSNADDGLAVKVDALVVLAELLVTEAQWIEALDVAESPILDRSPSDLRKRVLTARRMANEALGHWEQAAWCHDELERHAQHVAEDLLMVYELRFEAHQADALEEHNQLLQEKNDELELLSFEKDSTMEMIANDLQSPLTSLQLTIDLLEADPSTSNIQSRVGTALRSINRIETIAMHLSLAGEIDAGNIVAEESAFVLAESVASVVERSAAILDERGIQLQVSVEDVRLGVFADEERFEQVLGAALWAVAEFSTPKSVLKLKTGTANEGVVDVRLEAPDLNLSLDALTLMRTRSVSSLRSRRAGAGVDLAFYAADQLGTIIGVPLSVGASGDSGNSFTFRLTLAQNQPVAHN